jgi:hypothetical protein
MAKLAAQLTIRTYQLSPDLITPIDSIPPEYDVFLNCQGDATQNNDAWAVIGKAGATLAQLQSLQGDFFQIGWTSGYAAPNQNLGPLHGLPEGLVATTYPPGVSTTPFLTVIASRRVGE